MTPSDIRIGMLVVVCKIRKGLDNRLRRSLDGLIGKVVNAFELPGNNEYEVIVSIDGKQHSFYNDELDADISETDIQNKSTLDIQSKPRPFGMVDRIIE